MTYHPQLRLAIGDDDADVCCSGTRLDHLHVPHVLDGSARVGGCTVAPLDSLQLVQQVLGVIVRAARKTRPKRASSLDFFLMDTFFLAVFFFTI